MPRLRFETVRDLLEAFPIAEPLIEVAPSDEPSLRFLEDLVRRGSRNAQKPIARSQSSRATSPSR